MSGSVAETEARYEAREPARVRRPFTVEEFLRAAEAGVFDPDERLELVEGEIERMMTPIGPDHSRAAARIVRALLANLPSDYLPVGPTSVRIDERTMLEPDIVVMRDRDEGELRGVRDAEGRAGSASDPDAYPTLAEAALVVEVADSSLEDDLGRKARLYAKGGAPEYWVADARGRRLVVHREPTPDGYGSIVEYPVGAKVSPEAFPGVVVDLAEIFGGEG